MPKWVYLESQYVQNDTSWIHVTTRIPYRLPLFSDNIVNSRYAVFGPLFWVLIWPITYRNADERCSEITRNGPPKDPYLASFWVLFDLKSYIYYTYDMSFNYMIASRSWMVPYRTPNTHLQNTKMKISTNPMPHNNTGSQNTIIMTLNNPLLDPI